MRGFAQGSWDSVGVMYPAREQTICGDEAGRHRFGKEKGGNRFVPFMRTICS